MRTVNSRSAQSFIPRYQENGALQIIVASGVPFIIFHFIRIVLFYSGRSKEAVFNIMFPNAGLSSIEMFQQKAWTIITYGWLHQGFFDWVTNMIWLYCFGSVLQNLAGYKQIIPLFVYALLAGGACYIGCQLLPYSMFQPAAGNFFMGAQAGVIALGFAAFTLAPRYKVHIAPGFSIPLIVIVGIYLLLDTIVYMPGQMNVVVLCIGGALTGVIYALLLKNNFRPGEWVYDIFDKLQRMVTPDENALAEKKSTKRMEILRTMYEPKKGISQQRIDEILDKINEKGYHALSREEKDILLRAGKD